MTSQGKQSVKRDSRVAEWAAVARFPKFGAKRLGLLMRTFGSGADVLRASVADLVLCGIEPLLAELFVGGRRSLSINEEAERMQQHNITAVTILDETYPQPLHDLFDPPALLFYRGELPDPTRATLSVVGSRYPTSYGKRVTREIVDAVARSGAIIVSGMAYGIDALAHDATVEAGGKTVAALGGGADNPSLYPKANQGLASRILSSGGCLLSEFPVGTHVAKQNFPFRNRIIAALSQATLVVEAKITSGSLITARSALDIHRDVFAVPGPVHSPLSQGPNNLIKTGAQVATGPEDLLLRLGLQPVKAKHMFVAGSMEESTIHSALGHDPLHADEITTKTNLPAQTISSTLTLMEIKGSARHLGGLYYVRG
jgi:DNA processing protein